MDVESNKDNYNYSFKDHRTFKNGKLTGKTIESKEKMVGN